MTVKRQKEVLGIPVPFTKRDAPIEEITVLERYVRRFEYSVPLRTLQVRDGNRLTYSTPAIELNLSTTVILSSYTRDLVKSEITDKKIRSNGIVIKDRYTWEPTLSPQAKR